MFNSYRLFIKQLRLNNDASASPRAQASTRNIE